MTMPYMLLCFVAAHSAAGFDIKNGNAHVNEDVHIQISQLNIITVLSQKMFAKFNVFLNMLHLNILLFKVLFNWQLHFLGPFPLSVAAKFTFLTKYYPLRAKLPNPVNRKKTGMENLEN